MSEQCVSLKSFENVRSRPVLLDKLLPVNPSAGTALYPNIYVSPALHQDLLSETPDPRNLALIAHEQTHIRRAEAAGVLRWYTRYLLNPSFRLDEELEATRVQFTYLKAAQLDPDLEHRAKILSGAVYLWPTTYQDAFVRLRAIWDTAASDVQSF